MGGEQFDDTYTGYQLQRGRLRTWARHFHLRSASGRLAGATLDFGCDVVGGRLISPAPRFDAPLRQRLRLRAGSRGCEKLSWMES